VFLQFHRALIDLEGYRSKVLAGIRVRCSSDSCLALTVELLNRSVAFKLSNDYAIVFNATRKMDMAVFVIALLIYLTILVASLVVVFLGFLRYRTAPDERQLVVSNVLCLSVFFNEIFVVDMLSDFCDLHCAPFCNFLS
jgi:hypothetical protein